MTQIKKKLIHFLGGIAQNEHDNLISLADKNHAQALSRITQENERLQRNLTALEHAVEDSRSTGLRTIATVEKPIHTLRVDNVILEEAYASHPPDEVIKIAKQYVTQQITNTLLKDNLIDFKVSDDFGNKKISATIYVREP